MKTSIKNEKSISFVLLGEVFLFILLVILFCKFMFATRLYFPFEIEIPNVLYNKSQTIFPLGDGYHIEIFKITGNNFQSVVDKNKDKKWIKGPLKSEYLINAYKFLTSFGGVDYIDIGNDYLFKEDGVYFYFEYIEPQGEYFDSGSVWVYSTKEMKLYYFEGSV